MTGAGRRRVLIVGAAVLVVAALQLVFHRSADDVGDGADLVCVRDAQAAGATERPSAPRPPVADTIEVAHELTVASDRSDLARLGVRSVELGTSVDDPVLVVRFVGAPAPEGLQITLRSGGNGFVVSLRRDAGSPTTASIADLRTGRRLAALGAATTTNAVWIRLLPCVYPTSPWRLDATVT